MRGLYLTTDLMFSSRVLAAAATCGFPLDVCMSAQRLRDGLASGDVGLVIIDLTMSGVSLVELVAEVRAAAPNARLVAYGPHVQEAQLQQARLAGCHDVLSRGEFNAMYPSLFHQDA